MLGSERASTFTAAPAAHAHHGPTREAADGLTARPIYTHPEPPGYLSASYPEDPQALLTLPGRSGAGWGGARGFPDAASAMTSLDPGSAVFDDVGETFPSASPGECQAN